jgi:hypothetical protein
MVCLPSGSRLNSSTNLEACDKFGSRQLGPLHRERPHEKPHRLLRWCASIVTARPGAHRTRPRRLHHGRAGRIFTRSASVVVWEARRPTAEARKPRAKQTIAVVSSSFLRSCCTSIFLLSCEEHHQVCQSILFPSRLRLQ